MKKVSPAFSFNITREGIEARISELEMKIDRLRSMYESYFMGMERMPPNVLRRDMNRMMLELQQVPIGNAALRFRYQALSQKWVLHITYWNRTMREIEAGTYRRDMARAQRHMAQRGGILTEEEAITIGIPKNRVRAFIARQQKDAAKRSAVDLKAVADGQAAATESPALPAAISPVANEGPVQSRPRPGPPPIPVHARRPPTVEVAAAEMDLPGLPTPDFDSAYEKYLSAHRELGREAEAATKDKIRARLGKQLPKILAEQRCDRVRLEIAVEDGKVKLRAWAADGKQS